MSSPTSAPSTAPISFNPTYQPSQAPTLVPTPAPSPAPVSYNPTYQPSPAPTLAPTSAPSAAPVSYNPTYQPSRNVTRNVTLLPVVTQINVLKSANTSVDLAVMLEWQRPSSTSLKSSTVLVYCAALNDGSSPTSIGTVKTASVDGSVNRGILTPVPLNSEYPLKLSMTITGLYALQKYEIYCYVENASGVGSSLKDVIATRVSTTTACCKSIRYTNAPPYVHSNVSRYSVSSPTLFVFTYALSSAPLGELKVTPLIYLRGILDTSIVATPASTTFSSTSPLTGQFYLSASPATVATLKISLLLDGTNPRHYTSPSTTVQLLSKISALPAPTIISSQFADSGDFFLIKFDAPTDEAGNTNVAWACSTLFTFSDASKMTCTWVNAATVKASFPVVTDASSSVNFINVGDTVTVRSSKLRAFCKEGVLVCASNPTAFNSVVMLSPLNPVAPEVMITAPATLGLCSNLVLDATGSYGHGGRMYISALWTVSAASGDDKKTAVSTVALGNYLNSIASTSQVRNPTVIEREQLVAATYSFTLRLANFFNRISSSTVNVEVTGNSSMPLLTIIGPKSRTIYASSSLAILSTGSSSTCATAAAMSYKWTVELDGVPVSISSTSPDPLVFSALPYTISVDKTYKISVNAISGKSSAAASVLVYVSRGDVTAAVVGGYSWAIPVNQTLDLNALISTDADAPLNAVSTLKYKVCKIICMIYYSIACRYTSSMPHYHTSSITAHAINTVP